MTSLIKFSDAEESFLASLRRNKKKDPVSLIPDDMDSKEVLDTLDQVSSVLGKIEKGVEYAKGELIPLLGRVLSQVATRKLWQDAGYKKLEDFIQDRIISLGVGRSSVFEARRISETFPELTIERTAAIGSKKLTIAAGVFEEASPAQKRKAIEAAEKSETVSDYREWVETKSGMSEEGGTSTASFNLIGRTSEIRQLREFLADEDFISYAGADRPIAMILAAIKESSTEWASRPAKKKTARKKAAGEEW